MPLLFPPFLHVSGENGFPDMWEAFCYHLISLDKKTDEIIRRKAPDYGIDLYWPQHRIAYQCKSVESGKDSAFDVSYAKASMRRALEAQSNVLWEKYVICTNVELTGSKENSLREIFDAVEFRTRLYWIGVCGDYPQKTRRFFRSERSADLYELPEARNRYEVYDLLCDRKYSFSESEGIVAILRKAQSTLRANVIHYVAELLQDLLTQNAWLSHHKLAGILANILSKETDDWHPNDKELKRLGDACDVLLKLGDPTLVGVIEPVEFSLGVKGLGGSHARYLRLAVRSAGWRHTDMERVIKYYDRETTQIESFDRHLHDSRRTGLLRANDLPRILESLEGGNDPSARERELQHILFKLLKVLKQTSEVDLLNEILRELKTLGIEPP